MVSIFGQQKHLIWKTCDSLKIFKLLVEVSFSAYSSVPNNRPPPRLLIFEKFSNPPFLFQPPLLLILVTKTQTVQIFWTIFLANVITHYHYTVCKVYKQYIVRLAISRSIFDRYFERKILFKQQKVFKILFLCLNALIL